MTAIELPRAKSGPEPQLLLTSLLGDHWYWNDEHIPSTALVRLLAEFGITADGARAAMRRLVARGLLTMTRSGRTTAYGIPPRTSEVIVERTHRWLTFGAHAPEWDGTWTVLAFSVPEQAREVRTQLRAQLRVLGFAAHYDGVWVCPRDAGAEAREVLVGLGLDTATILRATVLPGSADPASAFDLSELAAEYRAFVARYEPLLDVVGAGELTPAAALRTRTELRLDWRRFPETDPDLPAELLPADFPRARAQQVFVQIYDQLGPLAEQRFREVIAESDPGLAALARHHDSATVIRLHTELGERRPDGETPFEQVVRARRLDDARPGARRPR